MTEVSAQLTVLIQIVTDASLVNGCTLTDMVLFLLSSSTYATPTTSLSRLQTGRNVDSSDQAAPPNLVWKRGSAWCLSFARWTDGSISRSCTMRLPIRMRTRFTISEWTPSR